MGPRLPQRSLPAREEATYLVCFVGIWESRRGEEDRRSQGLALLSVTPTCPPFCCLPTGRCHMGSLNLLWLLFALPVATCHHCAGSHPVNVQHCGWGIVLPCCVLSQKGSTVQPGTRDLAQGPWCRKKAQDCPVRWTVPCGGLGSYGPAVW